MYAHSQPRKPTVILGCTKSSMTSRSREMILSLYSILMRPQLENCILLWIPQCRKDMDLLEWVERKATKMKRAGTPLL